jgi:hypothetical protein
MDWNVTPAAASAAPTIAAIRHRGRRTWNKIAASGFLSRARDVSNARARDIRSGPTSGHIIRTLKNNKRKAEIIPQNLKAVKPFGDMGVHRMENEKFDRAIKNMVVFLSTHDTYTKNLMNGEKFQI